MRFSTPRKDFEFDIPDEWWSFAEMEKAISNPGAYYPYSPASDDIQVISLYDIEPPQRSKGVPPFKKYKLVPVLLAFQSPECALPPLEIAMLQGSIYQYLLTNGYHRYYSSIAVGFTHAPAIVRLAFEW